MFPLFLFSPVPGTVLLSVKSVSPWQLSHPATEPAASWRCVSDPPTSPQAEGREGGRKGEDRYREVPGRRKESEMSFCFIFDTHTSNENVIYARVHTHTHTHTPL